MTTRAVAVHGIGFGALAVATMGFLGGVTVQPEIGLLRFVDATQVSREVESDGTARLLSAAQQEREIMADEVKRTIEVQPVESGIEVEQPEREIEAAQDDRTIEVTSV